MIQQKQEAKSKELHTYTRHFGKLTSMHSLKENLFLGTGKVYPYRKPVFSADECIAAYNSRKPGATSYRAFCLHKKELYEIRIDRSCYKANCFIPGTAVEKNAKEIIGAERRISCPREMQRGAFSKKCI